MKGFYIYEAESHKEAVDCLELGGIEQSFAYVYGPGTLTEKVKMHALVTKGTKSKCSSDDTYDFETGALISLMKMCGVDKVVRACNEAFSEDTFKTYATMYERELNDLSKKYDKVVKYCDTLRESNKRLQKEKELIIVAKNILYNKLEKENKDLKKNIDELFESEQHSKSELGRLYFEKHRLEEENEKLKLDCEKLQHGYNDMIFCGGRQNGKQYTLLVDLFKKIDQKKVDEAYKEAYGSRVIWCSSQSSTRDMLDSLLDSCKYAIVSDKDGEKIEKWTGLSEFSWEIKIPTKREEMWERILEIHKKSNVIIVVEKEDVDAFLHEIENRIPEIRWASWQKIFEAKGTIKDMYEALKTCDRIYFRLWKENELSYSSDPDIYQYKDLEHISYLPPMRWDLFKKGRIAVKVNYNNYKDFYAACMKELGKKPSSYFSSDYTVSICKKDGCFEIFTIEDQKKTGRKIVDWEDVR